MNAFVGSLEVRQRCTADESLAVGNVRNLHRYGDGFSGLQLEALARIIYNHQNGAIRIQYTVAVESSLSAVVQNHFVAQHRGSRIVRDIRDLETDVGDIPAAGFALRLIRECRLTVPHAAGLVGRHYDGQVALLIPDARVPAPYAPKDFRVRPDAKENHGVVRQR